MAIRKGLISLFVFLLPCAALLAFFVLTGDLFVIPFIQGKFAAKAVMPDLRDQDSASAAGLLASAGLTVGEVQRVFHESVPSGRVIKQQPLPGVRLKPSRRVKFTLSLGEEMVVLPNLRSLSPTQAGDTLQKLGLRLGEIKEVYGGEQSPGTITSSNPPSGGSVARGGTVSITISQNSLTGRTFVPDFVRLSLEQAKKALAKYHLRLRQVSGERDPEMLPGTVLRQSVEAGSEVDRGTFIDFTVSE